MSLLETKAKGRTSLAIKTAYKIYLKNKKLKEEFTKIVTLSKEQRTIMKVIDKNILKCSV